MTTEVGGRKEDYGGCGSRPPPLAEPRKFEESRETVVHG